MAKKVVLLAVTALFLCGFQLKTKDIAVKLPSNWNCEKDGRIWVCKETGLERQKSAVILVQARKAKIKETQSYFRKKLSQVRSIKGAKGRPLLSKILSIQDRQIGGQTWFEAVHSEGELDSYYTHYLAARVGDLSYLLTMSAHKDKWPKYRNIFYQVSSSVQILTPRHSQKIATRPQIQTSNPGNANQSVAESENQLTENNEQGLSRGPTRVILFLGIVALAGCGLYLLRS